MLTVVLLLAGTVFVVRGHLANEQAKRDAAYAAAEEALNPIKIDEIDALLAGQAKALKDRDEKAFLAAYDPADKKLVDQQGVLFRNLMKVPFAEAAFKRLGEGSAFRPVGTGASVDHVVAFVHKIDGYDLHPVDEQYEWTIVRTEQGGPIKVTAVKGITNNRGEFTYYPAPWDKWRTIHVERTKHTLFIVDGSLKAQAKRYAPQAERAAVADLAAWRAGGVAGEIPQGFVISLVKGKKDLASLYRRSKEPPTEAGKSYGVRRFQDINAPDDDKAPLIGGSRVVIDLNTGFFDQSVPEGPSEIFRHELAHSMVAALTYQEDDLTLVLKSSWVTEGFAEYLENEQKPWTTSPRTPAAKESLRTGWSLGLKDEFNRKNAESTDLAYWCGHAAIGYIAEKYGEPKAFEVVAEHYRGKEIKDVLQEVLDVSYEDFYAAWEKYVKAKIR
ncbi:hypothetical protein [Asanoa ishikariensis]|uniref:hypothetical protein n=1 Tax=Asanoa ishikariensis TaxID=137265 RepID=UPI000B827324|nr:hypothetical protein [Asanoa ishikariensis]